MKNWLIDYSIKYINGKTKEKSATVQARNISLALGSALGNIRKPLLQMDPEVSEVVIWNIGIIDDDVFEEVEHDKDHDTE